MAKELDSTILHFQKTKLDIYKYSGKMEKQKNYNNKAYGPFQSATFFVLTY